MFFKTILFLFLSITVSADETSLQNGAVRFDLSAGRVMINPAKLNETHSNLMIFGQGPVAVADFKDATYFAISAGKVFDFGLMSFRYETWKKEVGDGKLYSGSFGGSSVSFTYGEYFVFEGVTLMFELPFKINQRMEYSLGAGAGYGFRYEFHQVIEACKYCLFPCEDSNYAANPFTFKLRSTLGFKITKNLGAFAEIMYDYMTAKGLKFNFTTLQDADGNDIEVNMSGLRFGVGARLDL